MSDIEKEFRLSTSLSCNNLVLFDRNYKIQRFENECEILDQFFNYRYEMYVKRRASLLDSCKKELDKFQNQFNFVEGIIKGSLVILGKQKSDVVHALKA